MTLTDRIIAFEKLGQFLAQFSTENFKKNGCPDKDNQYFEAFSLQLKRQQEFNAWFTKSQLIYACKIWSTELTNNNLRYWTSNYTLDKNISKTVAIIMAGNIPLVGFHDFISALIAGHKVLVKQSRNDKHLLPLLAKYLEYVAPKFKDFISFTNKKLEKFDAVIATGSNNTARYFDYYFEKYPNIIRKSRNSVAVLTGNETYEELTLLGEDIFRYFGLGCRSVSKLYVPKNYDFDQLFKAVYQHKELINYQKYQNNYDYNKAVYLMSEFKLLENGFLMLKEDPSYASPIATLFYEYYDNLHQLERKINNDADKIQCVVTQCGIKKAVPFGTTQQPKLWDYADGVDTMAFLESL
ncbi:MAG: acyl-CoA reductase [Flavobacteriaceae bacterium]|nr:acyl-CoA reductase [Flavobacteriaceae bacterium]